MADENRTDDDATDMVSPEEMEAALEDNNTNEASLTNSFTQEAIEEEETPISQVGFAFASLRDRAAAAFFDLMVLGYLYFATWIGYNFIVWRLTLRPIPVEGKHGIIFHSVVGLVFFLYFFISEGVFFTTLGKFFGRLSIHKTYGEDPSLFAIFIRNLLRPIDYLLMIWPTWILIEKLPRRQRIGDLLAGTVITKFRRKAKQRSLVTGNTASATIRTLSGIIDLLFSTIWIAGFLLFIDHQRPILSLLVILLMPVIYLLWHLPWEGLFHTTIGGWIFGTQIVREDGSPAGFAEVLIRSIFKIFDTNPLGWMVLYFANRNQKPSDLAAGTFVVYSKRSWKTLIGLVVSLAAIAAIWIAGLTNPRSFLTPFFKLDFAKQVLSMKVTRTGGAAENALPNLAIKRFSYLTPDRQSERPNAEFKPGESIVFSFDVAGFTVRDNEAWIQEDLLIHYPDNSVGFKQETIVDFHQMLRNPETPLEIVNTLALPLNAQPGHYILTVVLHDRFSDRHLTEQRAFLVVP